MGIFDSLLGMSQDQNQGLLGLASGMLQASGPSRMPVGFGQVLGAGLQGMQQADAASREREMQALQAKIMGFKVKDAESDLVNQEAQRKRAADLIEFNRKYYAGQQGVGAVTGAPETPDTALGTVPQTSMPGQAPAVQAQPTAAGGSGQKMSIFADHMARAQALRAAGYVPEADATEERALKFQPKVKGWEKVQQNGQVLFAPFFEDGTSGQPVPLEVAEKLEKVDTGGTTAMVNPFTGATVRSMQNTAAPAAVLAANTAMRGQNMTDARAREALDVQRTTSKVPAGYRLMPDGSLAPIPGGPADPKAGKDGVQRTQDANDVLSILNQAEPLLKSSTSSYIGAGYDQLARAIGKSTAGAESAAQLKVLQGALVAKMPKMSGPQSDKDVQLYREMAGQIGDSTLPVSQRQAAADTVRSLNEKYLGMKPGDSRPAPAAAAPVMDSKPAANASNKGRTIVEHETSKRYRSNGIQWVEVK